MRVVQQTPLYTVVLDIGAPAQMIMPGDMTAKSGEVMINGGPMSMGSGMSMSAPSSTAGGMMMTPDTDQGMVANHHLEIHLTRNSTGAMVQDVTPVIRITDKATGASRDLPQVAAMYDMQMGVSDLHYGQNVWLPDGTYEVTVMLGPDQAEFRDVTVSGGSQMMRSGG